MIKFFSLLFLLLFSACATLNKEDCTKMNWIKRGYQDASVGDEIKFSRYQEQCQEFKIAVPEEDYVFGYKQGLKKYCNYQNGLTLGQRGREPFTPCESMNSNFYRGYQLGFKRFEEEQEAERRKKKKQEALNDLISRYGSDTCTSSFDCRKDGECRFNKCVHDDSQCTFNSDCKIKGDCRTQSEYVHDIKEWVEARVCDY